MPTATNKGIVLRAAVPTRPTPTFGNLDFPPDCSDCAGRPSRSFRSFGRGRRKRSKQELPLKVRLEIAAERYREAARNEACKRRCDDLLQAARSLEITALFGEWLSSSDPRGRRTVR
jgi:hypothetical protein